ncbi:MAG: toll/interleukin-1 receptor domain-containing protein [Clostridia bacterium]|nr:toll/interleukin-1 receptor domain-containing protein [Clostridia bacterium]
MDQQGYCAFISYRHQSPDQEIAKMLHTAIETYGIPAAIKKQTGRKTMGKVFRDQEELPLSADLGGDIEAALDRSEWFIAICSPRYPESKWCMRELEYFIARKGRDHVLTLLVEGEPEDSFPEVLRLLRNEDGTETEIEPLAADVRGSTFSESAKKLKSEKLRILAPMLGLGFDDLKRRARQRRIRLAVTAAAAVFVAAAAFTTYLVVNHMRNEALKREAAEQQRIAEEQAALAAERQKLAEEEQRRAEEERRNAIYNDLGERMERAAAALNAGEKREAAKILIDAYAISEENEQMRHNELLALLRRAMYIEPFTIVSSFNNQNMQLLDIKASPDGTRAVGVVNNNSIAMVDLLQNEILYTVTADNALMMYPCFSDDGARFLAYCDYGRFVAVWNTEDGSEAFRYTSKKDAAYEISNAVFWKGSDTILVQDADKLLLVDADGTETLFYTYGEQMPDYNPDDNIMTRISGMPLDELYTNVADGYAMDVLVTADCERVVITGKAGETGVIVLDGQGKRVFMPTVPGDPTCMMPGTFGEKWSISPDGKTLCCLSLLSFIAGWDMDTGEMIFIEAVESNSGDMPSTPIFTPDSGILAYTFGSTLYVCDAGTATPFLVANLDETNYIPSIRFTSDGKYLLMTNEAMFIINAETWAAELIVSAEGTNYNGMVPMENMVLCSRYDGVIYFYSMPALASVTTADSFSGPLMDPYDPQRAVACVPLIRQHELSATFLQTNFYKDYPSKLCFSRDGSVAAIAYPDGTIELFDTQGDGTVRDTIGQLYTYINALAISEDRLIAIDMNTRMMVYNLNTHSVETIQKNGTQYTSFAFNGDGSLMMALCEGLTRIDVFDLDDGCRLLFSLQSSLTFSDMAFSADGAYAVGVTASGTYVIGDLFADEAALIARAESFASDR